MIITDISFLLNTALVDITNDNFSFGVITICAICLLVLVANILRRKIPFLRRSCFPTAVIAGLMGMVIKEIIVLTTGFNIFQKATLDGLVYHSLAIGFIALCLRDKDDYAYDETKADKKIKRVNPFKSGAHIVSTYLIQGIVGVVVTVILAVTFIPELNKAVGLILPLGFGQGPGQAYNTGQVVWGASVFDTADLGGNFGITVAAFGFLWASIPGVIIINRIAKKRGINLKANEYPKSGAVTSAMIEEPNEVPLSESIDKFSLQVCMVGAAYLATMGLIVGIEAIFRATGVAFLINLIPTIWGFSFMIGVVVALISKQVLKKLLKKGVMRRKYPNSYMMNRISGVSFDLSITGALCLISVTSLGILWVPLIIMTTIGGFVTIFFIRFLCNRVYPDYKDEAFLAMYGMLTGTISNGMILLREIDPEFKTPAADDLVTGSSTGIILGFPLLLLIAQAPKGQNIWWVTAVLIVYLILLVGYQLNWHKKIFKRKAVTVPAGVVTADGAENIAGAETENSLEENVIYNEGRAGSIDGVSDVAAVPDISESGGDT